jgi:Zn finger protein HypA/HybF involved in hydrogenase expression
MVTLVVILLILFLCAIGIAYEIANKILEYIVIIIAVIITEIKEKNEKKKSKVKYSYNSYSPISQSEKNRLIKEYSKPHIKTKTYNNYNKFKSEDEEFYCERCFKKISEDEYEMNDCMCEDCYTDVHLNDTDF